MKKGISRSWINAASDEIVFDYPVENKLKQFFLVPLMVGKTNPDPSYFVDRKNGGLTGIFKNLFVVEYVTKGAGFIEYKDVKKRVEAGDLYILNRGISAKYYSDPECPYEKKWINLIGVFFGELLAAVNITEPVFIIHMEAEKYLDGLAEILADSDGNPDDETIKKICHVLSDLFFDINKQKTEVQKKNHQVSAEQVGNYIMGHLTSDPLVVADIAGRFGISERHLNRLFQQRYSCSPVVFITKRKIEYAQQLLIEGKYSVEEIAVLLHYTGADYFRKVFVAECGMSPVKWKSAFMSGKVTR